jgi:hypothetical protein
MSVSQTPPRAGNATLAAVTNDPVGSASSTFTAACLRQHFWTPVTPWRNYAAGLSCQILQHFAYLCHVHLPALWSKITSLYRNIIRSAHSSLVNTAIKGKHQHVNIYNSNATNQQFISSSVEVTVATAEYDLRSPWSPTRLTSTAVSHGPTCCFASVIAVPAGCFLALAVPGFHRATGWTHPPLSPRLTLLQKP